MINVFSHSGEEGVHSIDIRSSIAQQYQSYLRDSKQLINILEEIPQETNFILASIDVDSLYTNIRQDDVLEAMTWALKGSSELKDPQHKFISEALALAMKSNYFWHNKKYYRQHKGVVMCAKYAPSVANIFLSKWEQEEIYGKSRTDIALYKRYIEDFIILWRGTEAALQEFLKEINENQYHISLTRE